MADFARSFRWLQTGFPPSSRDYHAPGVMMEPINLTYPVYQGGWSTPDWAVFSQQSGAGQNTVSMGAPAPGTVRVIQVCSGKYSTPAAGPYHLALHLNIGGTATLATWIQSTHHVGAGGTLAADTYLIYPKTLVFGPAYELRCTRLGGADATATVSIQAAYIDIKHGEWDPAFIAG